MQRHANYIGGFAAHLQRRYSHNVDLILQDLGSIWRALRHLRGVFWGPRITAGETDSTFKLIRDAALASSVLLSVIRYDQAVVSQTNRLRYQACRSTGARVVALPLLLY